MTETAPSAPAGRSRELDQLTIARAQRGEDAACRALLACYQRPVFALLGRVLGRTGQRGVIEDLAQETFLRAFRALPEFECGGPARLSTWLLTIATRLALDHLRRRPLLVLPLAAAAGQPAQERADDTAVRQAIGAAIADAVEGLAPEYRAAFVLREFHEMAVSEVAAALDIPPDTVRSRLSRARAALRTALADLYDDPSPRSP